jgi:hypothetical protein
MLYKIKPQTMGIVDMAIHQVFCQKSDFHGNGSFRNSQKLDHLQKQQKKLGQNMLAFQRCFGATNRPKVHCKGRKIYTYAIWFV